MELRHYANSLLKWWWLIVASVIVATVSSYMGTRSTPSTYQARTTLMVGQALQNPNPDSNAFYTGEVLAQSYADLARREPVLHGALNELGLPWNWVVLQGMVSSRVVPGTQLLEVSIIDTDPERARILVNEIANQLIAQSPAGAELVKEADRQFISTQIDDLKANIKRAQDDIKQLDEVIAKANSARQIQDARNQQAVLQTQVSTWQATYAQLLTNLQQGTVNYLSVVEPAQTPGAPIGPHLNENLLLAAAIGLVLSCGAALLLEYIDDTVKTPDDAQELLDLPALGGIVRIDGDDYPGKLITVLHPRSPITEAYRVLRTNLQFSAVDKPLRSLMVTSPNPVEGKSITAANLAVVMAQAGKRVLLVDADLRRPVQHRIFQLSNTAGLTAALLDGSTPLTDLTQSTHVPNLRLLTAGSLPPNPSELLGSRRMGELIEALQAQSDIIIFDSPPVMAVTDAPVLATRLDGTLLVVDAGHTRRGMARRSKEALRAVGAAIIGVALNRLTDRGGGYYYYYYYYSEDGHRRHRRRSANPVARLFARNGHSPNGKHPDAAVEAEAVDQDKSKS